MDGAKITFIRVTDFMGLKEYEFRPGKINHLVGRKGAGKSSVIKAIETLDGGQIDTKAIRHGADESEILIDLEQANAWYRTRRRLYRDKQPKFEVRDVDNTPQDAPQSIIEQLIGQNPFKYNPVDILQKDAKEFRDYLLSILPVELTEEELRKTMHLKQETPLPVKIAGRNGFDVVNELYDIIYKKRTNVNRKKTDTVGAVKTKRAELQGIDLTESGKSRTEVETELSATRNEEKEAIRLQTSRENLRKEQRRLENRMQEIEADIARLQQELKETQGEYNQNIQILAEPEPDLAAIQNRIASLEKIDKQYTKVKELEEQEAALREYEAVSEQYTTWLNMLKTDLPAELTKRINLPIQGLEITEEDVLIDGVSVKMKSSGEQLKDIAIPLLEATVKSGFVCIDGIGILDHEVQKAFFDWAATSPYELILTETLSEQYRCSQCDVILFGTYEEPPQCPQCSNACDVYFTGALQTIRDGEIVSTDSGAVISKNQKKEDSPSNDGDQTSFI